MRRSISLFSIAAAIVAIVASCNSGPGLMPNVSGKAGEIIVVIDRDNWEGSLGSGVREILADDCPFLVPREPMFSLANVPPSSFGEMFKIHRNILIFNIDPQIQEEKILFSSDAWAHPQCVIQVNAVGKDSALALLSKNSGLVVNSFEQAERDRNIANAIKYENTKISEAVTEMVGGSPHFPDGYQLRKNTGSFIWVGYDTASVLQDILVYRFPAKGNESDFSLENLIAQRNAVLKENVPARYDGSYMTTDESYLKPSIEYIKFRGLQFAQVRGWWDTVGDWMGGPFVSHAFYGPDAKEVIVLEAFVHAPGHDKRQLLRQVESIIYSFEWKKPAEE